MRFEDFIKNEIRRGGPVTVAAFMGMASAHYYGSRDPFGAGGDFTTAPEISQMFGELLGAWAADVWTQMGKPPRFLLAECGPGRGTLMADALRATKNVAGFHIAAEVHLIEMSPLLRQKQQQMLQGYKVRWHETLDGLPQDAPLILLANEFLDALPVRQFQKQGDAWHERVVGLDGDTLQFGLIPAVGIVPQTSEEFCEISPTCQDFVRDISRCLKEQKGAALFVDYGYVAGAGETLQAVKNHQYVPVLEQAGEADLTAHVDFAALAAVAREGGAVVHGPVTQGVFLQRLGIGIRAAALKKNGQGDGIDAALRRLTAPEEMGELFKVMAIGNGTIAPAGF